MNINGVEFFWGKDFLPEDKKFNPISMVQASTNGCVRYSSCVNDLYDKLADLAIEAKCNAVIIQDRTDIAVGAGKQLSTDIESCTTITGHAGILKK